MYIVFRFETTTKEFPRSLEVSHIPS